MFLCCLQFCSSLLPAQPSVSGLSSFRSGGRVPLECNRAGTGEGREGERVKNVTVESRDNACMSSNSGKRRSSWCALRCFAWVEAEEALNSKKASVVSLASLV